MNLALFYVWKDARVYVHWNNSSALHLSYLGPVSYSSPSQFLRVHRWVWLQWLMAGWPRPRSLIWQGTFFIHILKKKYFIAKKCSPSSEPSLSSNLFANLSISAGKKNAQPKSWEVCLFGDLPEECSLGKRLSDGSEETFQRGKGRSWDIQNFCWKKKQTTINKQINETQSQTLKDYC